MEETIVQKRRPPHPGAVLAEILEDNKVTLTEFSKRIGVSRRTVSLIINGHRPVTVDLAIRIATFFGKSPELWLNLQRKVDLWDAMQTNQSIYQQIRPIDSNKAA